MTEQQNTPKRRGGRPRNAEQHTTFSLRIPASQYEAIRQMAKDSKRSISDTIREFINRGMAS